MRGAAGQQALGGLADVAGGVPVPPQVGGLRLLVEESPRFRRYVQVPGAAAETLRLVLFAGRAGRSLTPVFRLDNLLEDARSAAVVLDGGGHDWRHIGHGVEPQQQHHGGGVLHDVLRHAVKERLCLRAAVHLRPLWC